MSCVSASKPLSLEWMIAIFSWCLSNWIDANCWMLSTECYPLNSIRRILSMECYPLVAYQLDAIQWVISTGYQSTECQCYRIDAIHSMLSTRCSSTWCPFMGTMHVVSIEQTRTIIDGRSLDIQKAVPRERLPRHLRSAYRHRRAIVCLII